MNSQQDYIMNWIENAVILNLEVIAFITGAGGVGKSRIIAEIKKKYESISLITSLMAKAALAIGGRTLHSALKIPIGTEICGWLKDGELDGFSILIIDEVTLLDMHLINRIDEILRKAKNPNRPFGGMITLLFGDFLQLSPLNTSDQKEELKFIYDSYFWKDVVTLHLTKNMRTSEDPSYGDLVLRWREGVFSKQDGLFLSQKAVVNRLATKNDYKKVAEIINNLIGSVDHYDTMFVAHPNFVVDWMNYAITMERFGKGLNKREIRELVQHTTSQPSSSTNLKAPPAVVCIDMRILITESHNAAILTTSCDDKENKFNGSDSRVLNGTIGVVFAISPPSGTVTSISVRMENGVEYKIRQIRSNGRGAMYWPFRPSYATTFHKVQGMTLRNVFIDTHHSMMDGMFYVGSSRVRSAEGLHIVGPTPTYIKYNRKVLGEQRKIEAASIIPLV